MRNITTNELASQLDAFNENETSYDVLKELFRPFSNNLGVSHMELFAYAIESVYKEIQNFKITKKLKTGTIHIPGLNDSSAFDLFYRVGGIDTALTRLLSIIGFEESDVLALKEMLLQILENQVEMMKESIKKKIEA